MTEPWTQTQYIRCVANFAAHFNVSPERLGEDHLRVFLVHLVQVRKPLISHEVIVNFIASTRTTKGLTVRCEVDENSYPKGIKVTEKELAGINVKRHEFHGEWNYTIRPRSPKYDRVILPRDLSPTRPASFWTVPPR